jgi:hypothetical protein
MRGIWERYTICESLRLVQNKKRKNKKWARDTSQKTDRQMANGFMKKVLNISNHQKMPLKPERLEAWLKWESICLSSMEP